MTQCLSSLNGSLTQGLSHSINVSVSVTQCLSLNDSVSHSVSHHILESDTFLAHQVPDLLNWNLNRESHSQARDTLYIYIYIIINEPEHKVTLTG